MLQWQYYFKLLLIVLLGFVYILTMRKMAQYKPVEETGKRHTILYVVGGAFILLGIAEFTLALRAILQGHHIDDTILLPKALNDVLYRFSYPIIWSFTRAHQQIDLITKNVITFIGVGVYFLFFLKSDSNWQKKLMKFLFGMSYCFFFLVAANFCFIDIIDWVSLVLFFLMSFFVYMKSRKSEASWQEPTHHLP